MPKKSKETYTENGLIYENENKKVIVGYVKDYEFGSELVVPEGVEEIRASAFEDFKNNSLSLILPSSLREIDWNAFYAAVLKDITIKEGIEEIGHRAFYNSVVKTINLPDTVKSIGSEAFASSQIANINIKNVENIGECAFEYSDLEEITVPNSVKSMGISVFHNCNKLKTVNYYSDCDITLDCFRSCRELETFNISSKLKSIGSNAFYR